MSDPQPTGQSMVPLPDTTPAPRQRVFTTVDSPMGIMDTARFEHLGRVATVMARAGLMPMTLTHYKEGAGDNAPMLPHPFEVVQARAYLIANQADLWHADPNAVAQATSIVHGKLMYEGKLVHAIVSARLGVDLIYEFGKYNPAKRDIEGKWETDEETGEKVWVGDMPASVDDQNLGVRVAGTLPGEKQRRWIAGSVAMWHKGAKSPWGPPNAWPRQLRYMGAREWTRAHKPSLLIGILTDDEVDEYQLARDVGGIAPAGPAMLHSGFEERRPAQVIEGPKRTRAKREPDAPPPATETVDPLDGDDIPTEGGARPTETGTAQSAEPEPDTSASATAASEASPDPQDSSPLASSEPTSDGETVANDPLPDEEQPEVIAEGYPAEDEIYHLDGETFDPAVNDGRRPTYKNGKLHSAVRRKAGLKIYSDHAPVAEVTPPDHEDPQSEDEGAGDLPPEFQAYIDAVEAATTWVAVKAAMAAFWATDTFKAMSPAQQNKIRANTWDAVTEKAIGGLPDQAVDVSAFRLWIEWVEDADAIKGTLRVLEQEEGTPDAPGFAKKSDTFKAAVRTAVSDRLSALGA